ncbi:MAG: GNAT family N-acetyltransferase [Bacteroidetes bacterium B1(2017)]|nr:MAG: GNAT family N-acetyltransferase [Bacteroidetes bacterium B1(2017)]
MNTISYRTANESDLKQLQSLGLLAYGQFQNVIGNENWELMKSRHKEDETYLSLLKVATCFVCENASELVGMAFLIPHGNPTNYFPSDYSYIRLVGVHPKFEGRGIGRKLTQQCIDFAKATGEEIIALHTSEFQNAARHIYESLGFVKQKDLDLIYGKQYYLYTLKLN